jgi:hypothetical protein
MTTGYIYCDYTNISGIEHYTSTPEITTSQINKDTGLGITHFTINAEYKNKLKIRLERLLNDIKSLEKLIFIYADAANPNFSYQIDYINYGPAATEYLLKIYSLIYPINNNIKILYFCWNERKCENNVIVYIPFDYKENWGYISDIIIDYLGANINLL